METTEERPYAAYQSSHTIFRECTEKSREESGEGSRVERREESRKEYSLKRIFEIEEEVKEKSIK